MPGLKGNPGECYGSGDVEPIPCPVIRRGDRGEMGDAGIQGLKGDRGMKGDMGMPGLPGKYLSK